jgi:hypothetical protein
LNNGLLHDGPDINHLWVRRKRTMMSALMLIVFSVIVMVWEVIII